MFEPPKHNSMPRTPRSVSSGPGRPVQIPNSNAASPGLDRKTRSCITVAMLVALNHPEELKLHLRGALNNGVTPEELKEVLLPAAIYCGIPAANSAFRTAKEVL